MFPDSSRRSVGITFLAACVIVLQIGVKPVRSIDNSSTTLGIIGSTPSNPLTGDLSSDPYQVLQGETLDEVTTGGESTTLGMDDTQGTPIEDVPVPYGWAWNQIPWSWWIIFELGCAILGLVGNGLVIVVVFQRRTRNRSTDTLIGALAAADALTSLFIIPLPEASLVPNTPLGRLYCVIVFPSLLKWASISASTYTLVVISFDRYLAIVFPFKFARLVDRRKVSACIVIMWLVILAISFCESVFFVHLDELSQNCVYQYSSPEAQVAYGCFVVVYRLLFPTLSMLVTQTLIARSLYRQSKRFSKQDFSGNTASSSHLVARERVIKMMLLVIVVYVICWGPNQFFFAGINIRIIPFTYYDTPLHRLLTLLAFVNSCVNPLIYTIRHRQFRVAVRSLLGCGEHQADPVFSCNDQNAGSRQTEISTIT